MCGIVGVFSQADPVSPLTLARATRALHHRGPDSRQQWISENGRVGLGRTRLAVIDLDTGDQPIVSEDGQTRVVVNGEFYGYEAIRRELEARGHVLRTRSDSEIALHLFEDDGIQCLRQLRGEFALILWDARRRTLFAARDRFGIKPLFYAWHRHALYCASEAKALFAAGVPAQWDEESVHRSVAFGGHHTRTLFEGVRQIPPGHFLTATEHHVRVTPYWDFDYPLAARKAPSRPDAEYAEQLRHALDEAVRIRLRADVPVAVYLSGGLDSSAVLGLAARHSAAPMKAFTISFDRPDDDEGAAAEAMASRVGADHHPVRVTQADLADHFDDAIAQAETLCFNAHGVAKYLLSRAARDAGYKVVLTGEGADELFGGYQHFRRDVLAGSGDGQALSDFPARLRSSRRRNLRGRGGAGLSEEAGGEVLRRELGFVPAWLESFSARAARLRAFLSADMARRFALAAEAASILDGLDVPGQLAGREPLNKSLYLWSKTFLCGYILTMLGDRMEMAHSIEGRVPFLDHHVVSVAVSQPATQKIHGETGKFVLRQAVSDLITEAVHKRRKRPFMAPAAALSADGVFYTYMQDTLRSAALSSIPFVDRAAVLTLLDRLPQMDLRARVSNDRVLTLLASMCVLQRRYAPEANAAGA